MPYRKLLHSLQLLLCGQSWIAQPTEAKPLDTVERSLSPPASIVDARSTHDKSFHLPDVSPNPNALQKRFQRPGHVWCATVHDVIRVMDPRQGAYARFRAKDGTVIFRPKVETYHEYMDDEMWADVFPAISAALAVEREIQNLLQTCQNCDCDEDGKMVPAIAPPAGREQTETELQCREWLDVQKCMAWFDCYCVEKPQLDPPGTEDIKVADGDPIEFIEGIMGTKDRPGRARPDIPHRSNFQPAARPAFPRAPPRNRVVPDKYRVEGTKEPYYLEGQSIPGAGALSQLLGAGLSYSGWAVDKFFNKNAGLRGGPKGKGLNAKGWKRSVASGDGDVAISTAPARHRDGEESTFESSR
ncbi:hypothetical protein Dda_4324 [Drechslerella dactyloides]|uniref:Uncharacterized protein n=1 Tax=Drechslerella dactyloides TaxID=74499 RepID=A0AAD6IWN9_DREDA|nr:hypothetical protein Dda_4324 [Drechslerella dactyloides]